MKKILIFLASISLMFAVTGCGSKSDTNVEENKEEIKNDGVVLKEKEVDGLVFGTSSIVYDEERNVSVITFSVTNNNEEEYNLGYFTIILKDEFEKAIVEMTVAPNQVILGKGEATMVNGQIPDDIRRAVDFEYKKNQ